MLSIVTFVHVEWLWLEGCVDEEGEYRLSPSSTSFEACFLAEAVWTSSYECSR